MPERRDLFGECNADHHPIDLFTRECCANCRNPECTRSLFGKMAFDQRAVDWYPRFYGDQNNMKPDDPRFQKIAAQGFISISSGRIPDVGQGGGPSPWIDPRRPEPEPEPQIEPPSQAAPVITATTEETLTVPETPLITLRRGTVPQHLLLANAPLQQGMISAPPSATTPVPKDPWAGPVSVPKSDVPVVAPGARVKLGGSGV